MTSKEEAKTTQRTTKANNILKHPGAKINKETKIIFFLSFFIPVVVVLLNLAIQGFIPFGNSDASDIFTASRNTDFLTNYFKLYDHIHGLYESENIKDLWAFYMTDPSNLLVLIFPRTALISVLSILYAIKLGLSGFCFSIYLFYKSEKKLNITSLFITLAYSLSGYMLVYGTKISFLSAIVIFPLIILGLEQLINEGKWGIYYITLSLSIIINVYSFIVIYIFTVFYLIGANYKDLKHIIKTILYKITADILAVGSTIILIIPAIRSTVTKNFFFKEPPLTYSVTTIFDTFKRFLTLSEPSSTTNVDSGIDIYIGAFSILLFIIYLINPKFDIFIKIRRLVLITLLFLGTILTSINALFNAYSSSEYSSCFFAFTLIFYILIISHEVIMSISTISHNFSICATILSILLIIISMIFSHSYINSSTFIYSIEVIVVYGTLLFFNTYKKNNTSILIPVLCIFGILEITVSYSNGINKLSKGAISYSTSYSHDLYTAEQQIKNVDSNANVSIYNFFDDYFNPIYNSINSVDYILCPKGSETPDYTLEYSGTVGNVDVYHNPYSLNGIVYSNSEISEWTFSKSSPYKSSDSLLSYIAEDEISIFNRTTPNFTYSNDDYTDEGGKPHNEVRIMTFNISPADKNDYIIYGNVPRANYIGSTSNGETIIRQYPYVTKYLYLEYNFSNSIFYNFDKEKYISTIEYLRNINTKTSFDKDGFLLLSIGSKPLYTYVIDGKTISPIKIDKTLYAVPISKGDHSISIIEYIPYNITQLAILSLLFIVLSIAILKAKSLSEFVKKVGIKPYSIIQNNYVYIATVFITLLVFLASTLLKSCIPWGTISTLPSDGYVQTYPNIQSMIDTLGIRSLIPSTISFGTFIFSSGADYIASFIGTIIHLFYKLFIWTKDGKTYSTILALIQLLYSGPSIIFYMTHRYSGKRYNKKDYRLIIVGLSYSLSAYMIGYYSFSNFYYGLYVPLIIYGLERLVYKKKPIMYILLLSLFMIRGFYTAFLLCEFIALFFLTFDFISLKDFAKKTLNFAISSILAAGIAACTLLPSFLSTLNSAYRETDSEQLADSSNLFSLSSSILKTITQYQMAQNGVVVTPDNEMVNIYAGLLPLLCIFIYIFNKNINISLRIKRSILALILFWAFGNTFLNYVFHGFHFQSNVPNRFSVFFIFIILSMFADTLLSLKKLSKKELIIPTIVSAMLIILIWFYYPIKNIISLTLSTIFIAIYSILIVSMGLDKLSAKLFRKLICYITIIELTTSSIIMLYTSIGYLNEPLEDNIRSIGVLSEDIDNFHAKELYVSEYINDNMFTYNSGLINHLNTISGFSSSLNEKTQDMAYYWGLSNANNNLQYETGNPLADMMLHVKYQFIDTDDLEYSDSTIYNIKKTHNNMELVENPYYLPLGFMTDSKLMNWYESDLSNYPNYIDYQNAFARSVTGEDLYTIIEPPSKQTEEMYMNTYPLEKNTTGTGDLYVELKLPDDISGKIYCFFRAKAVYIGDTEKTENNVFKFTLHNYFIGKSDQEDSLIFGVLNTDTLQQLYNTFSESKMYDFEITKTYISGTIDVKNDGILYLSIPNFESTEIYVDNKKTEVFDYLHGTGLYLNTGKHSIKIQGIAKGYMRGVIITIVSIMLTFIYLLILKKQDKKNNLEEENKKRTTANTTHTCISENKSIKKKHKIKWNIDRKKLTYLAAFILPCVIMSIAFIYSGFAPFGLRDVLSANDQSEYLRYYLELYDRIHSGKNILGYSLHDGTGYDFTTIITYYLSDPTNILILIFPRTAITTVLNILYLLKIGLSGLTMSIYLYNTRISRFKSLKVASFGKKHNKNIAEKENNTSENIEETSKKDLVIGGTGLAPSFINSFMTRMNIPILSLSMMYALSNYMLGPGFNVAMQGAVVIFPLVILGLDKLIYDNKKKLYIISLALSFLLNFRISIITCIFTILYMLLPSYKDIRHIIKSLVNKLICDICVVLCTAVIILNNAFSTFWQNDITSIDDNSRVTNAFDVIKMMTTGIKPANVLLAGNNIYLYSGIITLLFILLFMLNNRIKLSTRIRFISLYCILFLGLMFVGLNTILNGFLYIDGLSSNYLYTMIFLGILIVYIEIKNLGKISIIRLILPSIICAALIICTIFLCFSYDSSKIFIMSLEFVFIYSIIVIIYCNKSMAKWLMKLSISITLIIELCVSLFPGIKTLSWFTYPYYRTIGGIIETSQEYAHELYNNTTITYVDPEKSTITPLDLALKGGRYVVIRGNSISNLEHIRNEKKDIITGLEYITNPNKKEQNSDITSITLLTEKYNHLKNTYHEGYNDPNIYKVFKGKDYFILDKSIENYTYNKYSHIDSINTLSKDVLHTPETMVAIDYEDLGGSYANGTNNIYIYHEDSGDLYFTYSYISCRQNTESNSQTIFTQSIGKNKNKFKKQLYKYSMENYIETLESLESGTIDKRLDEKTSSNNFTINSSKDGYMTIGLNNRLGWTIKVNDKIVKPISFLEDAMLIPVSKGTNNISISYKPYIFYIGLLISIISVVLLLLSTNIETYISEKRNSKKDEKAL